MVEKNIFLFNSGNIIFLHETFARFLRTHPVTFKLLYCTGSLIGQFRLRSELPDFDDSQGGFFATYYFFIDLIGSKLFVLRIQHGCQVVNPYL